MSLHKRLKHYNSHLTKEHQLLKFAALAESPFRFYRGTCHLFAEDFLKLYAEKGRVKTWVCGDAHIENFGSYKSDDRNVYFDINDFDEAVLGFPEIDVTRFLTSVIVAAVQLKVPSIRISKIVGDALDSYVATVLMRKCRVVSELSDLPELKRFFAEMSSVNRTEFIADRTEKKTGSLKLRTDGHKYLELPETEKLKLFDQLVPALGREPRFAQLVFEDAAIRIAGTASLGLQRYGLLFYSSRKGKQYLVDIKEARSSCYEAHLSLRQPRWPNTASHIVQVGYISQFAPPAFVTGECIDGKWFVVRELQPTADRMSAGYFENDFSAFARTTLIMADLIASAHLRSSGHFGADSADKLVKFAGKQQWRKDVTDLSGVLAAKNEKHYKSFLKHKK